MMLSSSARGDARTDAHTPPSPEWVAFFKLPAPTVEAYGATGTPHTAVGNVNGTLWQIIWQFL